MLCSLAGLNLPEGGALPFILYWIPMWTAAVIVTFAASTMLPCDVAGSGERGRGFNTFVHVLMAAGVVALLGEAFVIFGEGKRLQAVELAIFASAVIAFRVWVHRMHSPMRTRVNVAVILGAVALGALWPLVLDVILGVFDR